MATECLDTWQITFLPEKGLKLIPLKQEHLKPTLLVLQGWTLAAPGERLPYETLESVFPWSHAWFNGSCLEAVMTGLGN